MECLPWSLVPFYWSATVNPYTNTENRLNNAVSEFAVTEMTYKLCPTGVPFHHLKLKGGVHITFILIVMHPTLVNGGMFVVKAYTKRVLQVAAVYININEQRPMHYIA